MSFGAKFHGIKASVANSCHTYIFWSAVAQLVEALLYNSEGHGFDFQWGQSFRPRYGPGVDSASSRNEEQGYHLELEGGRCVGLTTLPLSCADGLEILGPSTSCSLSRPVKGQLIYMCVCVCMYILSGRHLLTFRRILLSTEQLEDGKLVPFLPVYTASHSIRQCFSMYWLCIVGLRKQCLFSHYFLQ